MDEMRSYLHPTISDMQLLTHAASYCSFLAQLATGYPKRIDHIGHYC